MDSPTKYAVSADGASIAYQVHGEGPLELVFVPGFVSHVEQGLSDRFGRPPTLEESMSAPAVR